MWSSFLERLLRGGAAQVLVLLPDIINWLGVAVLPTVPPPWNVILGVALNAIGSALRRKDEQFKWIPV